MRDKSTHTPGPWRADTYQNESNGVWNVTVNTDYPPALCNEARSIAVMTGSYYTAPGEFHEPNALPVNQANARLIAAAPDLLAACKALIGYAESDLRNLESDAANGVEDAQEFYDSCRESIAAGYAAISRAEGGAA
jgi:hypothetical protein